ncbi:MAG: SCO family protein [Candidatus Handelsmanbacteria bacterium]|nr:SCO family protein [Candidatus Handelsmanbacteria bacterium]
MKGIGHNFPRPWPVMLALACWLAGNAPLQGQPLSKEQVERIGIDQHLDEQLPLDLVFADERGRQVKLGEYFGDKPVVLTLVYYECPMLCTQVLSGLVRTLRMISFELGRDYEVVTVSFDPRETPELAAAKKAEYAKSLGKPGAETGWHFLTGADDQIGQLAQAVGFRYEFDQRTGQYIHAAGIVVLTPTGVLARYFYGIEFSPKDLRLGLIEAANEQIGNPVDQFLLLCFHYDPASGKYSLAVLETLRLAGGLTVLAIGLYVLVALRRERRRRRHELTVNHH